MEVRRQGPHPKPKEPPEQPHEGQLRVTSQLETSVSWSSTISMDGSPKDPWRDIDLSEKHPSIGGWGAVVGSNRRSLPENQNSSNIPPIETLLVSHKLSSPSSSPESASFSTSPVHLGYVEQDAQMYEEELAEQIYPLIHKTDPWLSNERIDDEEEVLNEKRESKSEEEGRYSEEWDDIYAVIKEDEARRNLIKIDVKLEEPSNETQKSRRKPTKRQSTTKQDRITPEKRGRGRPSIHLNDIDPLTPLQLKQKIATSRILKKYRVNKTNQRDRKRKVVSTVLALLREAKTMINFQKIEEVLEIYKDAELSSSPSGLFHHQRYDHFLAEAETAPWRRVEMKGRTIENKNSNSVDKNRKKTSIEEWFYLKYVMSSIESLTEIFNHLNPKEEIKDLLGQQIKEIKEMKKIDFEVYSKKTFRPKRGLLDEYFF